VIDNNSKLSEEVIRSYITAKPGEVLDIATLESDIQRLYGLNIFERVSYDITRQDNQSILTIKVRKKSWGPNYIRFGLNLESNFQGSSRFNLAASMTSTPLNSLGGEWRTELQIGSDQYISTEFYQPLEKTQRYFARIKAAYSELHYARYQDGEQLSDYKNSSATVNVAIGRDFANYVQLEAGLIKGYGDSNLLIGSRPAPEQHSHIGARYINFSHDMLDNINFPKHGGLSNVRWINGRKNLGADVNYDSLSINALWANTWGKNTFIFWTGLTGVVNSDAPTPDVFALGGFLNLSGYRRQELTGRYAGIARVIYLHQIGGNDSFFKVPVYVGGSLETGNTWNDKHDINTASLIDAGSLIVSFDTPVGPLYLAKGFAEAGKSAYYLFLGRSFTFF
jgi:NTE family protein